MPILNNIPRKNAPPIVGDIFQRNTHGHETILGFQGLNYNSPFTESDTPPLLTNYNVATQPQNPPLQVTTPGLLVPTGVFTRVHPSEKTVLHTSGKPRAAVNRQGGPSPSSDTPFHPKQPPPAPKQTTRPTATSQVSKHFYHQAQGSFLNTGSATGTLSQHVHADKSASRWSTVKTGAAEGTTETQTTTGSL
jgi:hypothetical protein